MEPYKMSTVLKRLEAATSRLEDIVLFSESQNSVSAGESVTGALDNSSRQFIDQVSPRSSTQKVTDDAPPMPVAPESIDASLKSPKSPLSSGAGSGSASTPGLDALKAIAASDLQQFVNLSSPIAEGVEKQAKAVQEAFNAMIEVVGKAITSSKPEMEQFIQLIQPVNTHAARVEEIRDEYRKDRALTNYLATVPAGVAALGWVTIEGKDQAAGFVQEMRDSAQFYGNRVLKDNKEAKPWVGQFIAVLESLRKVVKEHYPEGLKWNPNGPPASVTASAPKAAPASAGGPPPPPPPPPSVDQLTANLGASAPAPSASSGGLSGVFAELNQGESIASSLKPVDKSALKSSKPPIPKSTKPKPGSANTAAPGAPAAASSKKLAPRIELVESKWHIEDLDERHDIEITASMGQSVQVDNCRNCTIKILGKAATFNLSRSKKVGLLVETMVASCDIVNSSDFGLQVTGTVPSLMIDQCSQGSIYLSEESLGVDIFTSQTTAININIPEGEPGAYREVPLGEQILHNISGGNVKSSVVKHG